jgi:hypothetical protein
MESAAGIYERAFMAVVTTGATLTALDLRIGVPGIASGRFR